MDIVLFVYPTSPFVAKVSVVLAYLRLDHSFVAVSPIDPHEIGFTRQRQVPVLSIGGNWRTGSSDIGRWLARVAGREDLLGNGDADVSAINEVDHWVDAALIPLLFDQISRPALSFSRMRDCWRLARIVHQASPLPVWARAAWPFIVPRAPFVSSMLAQSRNSQSLSRHEQRVAEEFEDRLGYGPFLTERDAISIADLFAFAAMAAPFLMGISRPWLFDGKPKIRRWMQRLASVLPSNPLPCHDKFVARRMDEIHLLEIPDQSTGMWK